MKIAIATPQQAPGYLPLATDFLTPAEIRDIVQRVLNDEEESDVESAVCTLNRTVLDMARSMVTLDDPTVCYEDIVVWKGAERGLVPLLDLHDADGLAHFALGDLLERGEL